MNSIELAKLKYQDEANIYTVHGDIGRADCVIGFSFGYVDDRGAIRSGKSNRQIAAYIEQYFADTPLILQFEINDALQTCTAALIIRESRQPGAYLHSREIAEQAYVFMRQQKWRTAAIITHPALEARNIALCRKLGIETIAPAGLETIEYDETSAQPWTRDRNSWWQREQKSIQICLSNGWL